MKRITLLQFFHGIQLRPPELLDCGSQEAPCLIRQVKDNCYKLSRCWNGTWAEVNYFFDSTKERLNFIFSKHHGIEVIKQEHSANNYGQLIGKERFDQQMIPKRIEFVPCLFFYGYTGTDSYLCLEKQNGPIVCRTEDGTHLWQTEETYTWPGKHWPNITEERIEIFDFDQQILSIYSRSGEKLKTYQIPSIFQNSQYDLYLGKDNDSYYIDGFGENISKYYRVYLDKENKVDALFAIPDEMYAVNCSILGTNFLFTGERYRGTKYGDVGVLISREKERYVTEELFFHPSVQRDVGGGEIKWINDKYFYYWKPFSRTVLFCYKIDGSKLFQFDNLEYFEKDDIIVYQNQTYILSHRDYKDSDCWGSNREFLFTALTDKSIM